MKREKSIVQKVLEADEATQRDIRNRARLLGQKEPTGFPLPEDPLGSFDED